MHLKLIRNMRVYGRQSMIRVLNDPRDLALPISVGRLFHNLISDGKTANL